MTSHDTTTKFIKLLFTGLDGYIEIREVIDGKSKSKFFKNFDELKEYKPCEDKNIFLGMFSRRGRRGTKSGCRTTGVLWSDYDHSTFEEAQKNIKACNLPEPSIWENSGHGFHAYWLLDQRAGSEIIPVIQAIAEKTGGDSKVAEIARTMRLPGTWNLKRTPVKCEIIRMTDTRYSLQAIADSLDIPLDKSSKTQPQEKIEIPEFQDCPMACIRLIAKGVKKGQRNFGLGRITNWLKLKGYNRKQALEIVKAWNLNNTPPKPEKELVSEFNRFWAGDYKYLGCTFSNPALQAINEQLCPMGECEHHARQRLEVSNTENSIAIDNHLFKPTVYPKIEAIELAIYSIVAKVKEIDREHLAEHLNRQKSTFLNKAIKNLASMGYIEIESKQHIRQRGKSDVIRLKEMSNYGRGFTLINPLLDDLFISRIITGNEYKLMILLKRYAFYKTEVYPALEKLALTLGVTESYVSRLLQSLEKKLKIKRISKLNAKGQSKLFIELIY